MYVWEMFLDLLNGEGISYTEIDAYARVMHIPITGEEVRLIKRLEQTYWRTMNDN